MSALVLAAALVLPSSTGWAEAVVEANLPIQVATLPSSIADEGLAMTEHDGRPMMITRGPGSIPAVLRAEGWIHIGDPDSFGKDVVDAYQAGPQTDRKLFTISYPDGKRLLLVHRLVPGESYHNSFAAVSPNGRWLVSGEWGTMRRLLVFALPRWTPTSGTQSLPLRGVVALSRPVRDVQGCDFATSGYLLCSTNDPSTDLFPVPRQILAVDLRHDLRSGRTAGVVRLVGSAPAQDVCAGPAGEVEGIDVTDGVVRVAVNSPCAPSTQIFTYSAADRWGRSTDVDTAWFSEGASSWPNGRYADGAAQSSGVVTDTRRRPRAGRNDR